MKLLKMWILLCTVIPLSSWAQRNPEAIIDTVETPSGPAMHYKNFTWEYLQDEPVTLSQEDE